jgi:23S rRNA pseudouridine955/2504/2580 synthase
MIFCFKWVFYILCVDCMSSVLSSVQLLSVTPDDHDIRLDRWFKRHYADLTHGMLEKLLRTGQVRLDGKRTTSNTRIMAGQVVRIPPLDEAVIPLNPEPRKTQSPPHEADLSYLKSLILYDDADLMVLNKPSGLASQGGSGTTRHVDGLLFSMAKGNNRPVLVHRLDRDTSGCLVIAKKRSIAAELGKIFQTRTVKKTYWALLQGHPPQSSGKIVQPLVKRLLSKQEGEKMFPADPKDPEAQSATTYYTVLDHAGKLFSWVEMQPITGRTHQLRVHAACLKTPIVGDGKYGCRYDIEADLPKQLHLHARSIEFPHPKTGKLLTVTAPLPSHMIKSWKILGFSEKV